MAQRAGGWLERWREQEPLRLYLWTIAAAVLLGGVSTGLLTETWALAVGGVAAAVLMLGGTAAARAQVWPAAGVDQLLDTQHASSFGKGYQAALRTIEEAATQRPELAPATVELRAQQPATTPRAALGRCGFIDAGRHCTLPRHPRNIDHRLEADRRAE
jgi:hypothetical protein